ncbi:MAG: lipid-A-disaccharide synthase [Elusimicrobiaceae bacterium]|nr:lipid-A-disaccharide synthase [Elusimicrobiaceae bacterium]
MSTITPIVKNILIVAGDVSGDLHAAGLIRALKAADPDIRITAIGGKNMQPLCDHFLFDLAGKGASGFVEPLKKMPLWMKLLNQIRDYMETQNPLAVIVVDFYGFNHQVLGMAKHRRIPAYYYVTPQVWASRRYRAKQLAELTKKMFVIYPFEPDFHKNFGGNAVFLGNPLLDILPEPAPKTYEIKDPKNHPWQLGLLPGSRHGEIKRLAPVFYQAFKRILKDFPRTQASLFLLPDGDEKAMADIIGEPLHPQFHFVKDVNYQQRRQMDFLLACSGTATLENALLGVPMTVAYKMFWPTYQIAKMVIKVRYISLVNLLANRPLVKELIQYDATPHALAEQATAMFQNPQRLSQMRQELLQLRYTLGEPGVAKRAAQMILEDLQQK